MGCAVTPTSAQPPRKRSGGDAADRLTAVSGSPSTSFGYDGLPALVPQAQVGNPVFAALRGTNCRITMTVSGATTRYALDVAGGLPEVIAASGGATTHYLQVQGQILAQYDSGTWGYVAPDALPALGPQAQVGSVRQVINPAGAVTLVQSYDPFGNLLTSAGSGSSVFGYTGEQVDASTGLVFLRARYYNLDRFISPDTLIPDPTQPQKWNRYTYALNNPVRFVDPSGQTVRSALDLIRWYGDDIKSIARQYNIDPVLLAGVVFAENRNDYNWIYSQDWSSIFTLCSFGYPELKNVVGPIVKKNISTGITEVTIAVAAMMDHPDLVPVNYGNMSYEERTAWQTQLVANLPSSERQSILDKLTNPKASLEYTTKYLRFLSSYRSYGDNYALWLSDYNRGLSDWDTTSEYGRRIDIYRKNIEYALNFDWQALQSCEDYGCDVNIDQFFYGELP